MKQSVTPQNIQTLNKTLINSLDKEALIIDLKEVLDENNLIPVANLFADHILQLKNVTEAEGQLSANESLVFYGISDQWPFKGALTKLCFYIEQKKLLFDVTYYLENEWKFDTLFPEYTGHLIAKLPFLDSSSFTFRLKDQDDLKAASLAFESALNLESLPEGFTSFFDTRELLITGILKLKNGGEDIQAFAVSSPPFTSPAIGNLQLNDTYLFIKSEFFEDSGPAISLGLASSLSLSLESGTMELPLELMFHGLKESNTLRGNFKSVANIGKSEIKRLLNGVNFEEYLVPPFNNLANFLTLGDFYLDFSLHPHLQLHSVGLKIENLDSKELELIPGSGAAFSLQEIQMDVRINDPVENPSVFLFIQTSFQLGTALFHTNIFYPGWTFNAGLDSGSVLSVRELTDNLGANFSEYVPPVLKNLVFERCWFSSNLKHGSFSIDGEVEPGQLLFIGDIPVFFDLSSKIAYSKQAGWSGEFNGQCYIGRLAFDLETEISKTPKFKAVLANAHLSEMVRELLGENIVASGMPDIMVEELEAGYDSQDNCWSFGSRISSDISLKQLQKSLIPDIPLPLDMDVKLKDVSLDFQIHKESEEGKDYTLNFEASVITDINQPDGFQSQLNLEKISFTYHKVQGNKKETFVNLGLKGKANVNDAIIINDCSLDFVYQYNSEKNTAEWGLGNTLKAIFFDHPVNISTYIKDTAGEKRLGFKVTDTFPEIQFPELASFQLHDLEIHLNKKKNQSLEWDISALSSFTSDVFSFKKGQASFINQDGTTGIELSAENLELKISQDPNLPWFFVEQPTLSLSYNKASKSWECKGGSTVRAKNVPSTLSKVFPADSVTGSFELTKEKAEFAIYYDGMYAVPLPPKIEGLEMEEISDLGDLYVGVSGMSVDLKNQVLSANVRIGLPKDLNNVFKGEDGTETQVFRTYDPDGAKETLDFSLNFSKDQLYLQLNNSPFKDFARIEKNSAGTPELKLDMGQFGALAIEMPRFALKANGSLLASGGFTIERPLQLPLTPLKLLFKQLGLEDAANKLTPNIPLKGVSFIEKHENGEVEFKIDAFKDLFLHQNASVELPTWLQTGIDVLNKYASKLPSSLLEYANLEVPNHLHFEIDYNVSNSINCVFSVRNPAEKEQEPIPLKALVPQGPGLMGIKFYSLSFGELFSGTLFRMDVDLEVEMFDLPSLITSLALDPEVPLVKEYLPDMRKLHQKFELRNVVILIIYQTEIPIPIPLFYDKIGFSSLDLTGAETVSSFKFPMPEPSLDMLKDFALITNEMVRLFTEAKPIDFEKLKEIRFLTFTVGPNYNRLPQFISRNKEPSAEGIREGTLIGTEKGFTLDAAQVFFAVANAIQKGSINTLIKSVGLDRRIGELDMSLFDVLDVNSKYAFTTPYEFVHDAYPLLNLSEEKGKDYLDMLPRERVLEGEAQSSDPVTENTEGLILFTNGKIDMQDILHFETGFGFMAMKEGLGIGGKFDGKFASLDPGDKKYLLDILLKGLFVVRADGNIRIEGEGHLSLLGINFLKGAYAFDNNGIELISEVSDNRLPIHATGSLSGEFTNNTFHLEGNTTASVFGFNTEGTLKLLVNEDVNEFCLAGTYTLDNLASLNTRIAYRKTDETAQALLSFEGALSHLLDLDLKGALSKNNDGLTAAGTFVLNLLDHNIVTGRSSHKNGVFTVNGTLDLFPHIPKSLTKVTGDVTGRFSSADFTLEGAVSMKAASFHFTNGHIRMNHQKAIITSEFFGVKSMLAIQKEPSFRLAGAMAPIQIGPHFSITAGTQNTIENYPAYLPEMAGPNIIISENAPQLSLTGAVNILGVKTDIEMLELGSHGFKLKASGDVLGLIRTDFYAEGTELSPDVDIRIYGEIHLEDLVEKITERIYQVAENIKESLRQARQDLDAAKARADEAGKMLEEDIHEKIAQFDNELKNLENILADRQREVDNLNASINSCYTRIRNLKDDIEQKKRWYDKSKWYEKVYRLPELTAYVGAKGAELSSTYAELGVLEGAKFTAIGLLEAAKEAVRGVRSSREDIESAVDGTIKAFAETAKFALSRAQDALAVTELTVGVFEEWSTKVLQTSGELISIQRAAFASTLNKMEGGAILIEVDATFLGQSHNMAIAFNFANTNLGVQSLVDGLKSGKKRPDTIAIEARKDGKDVLQTAREILDQYPEMDASQMSIALLRGGYKREDEVLKIALMELYRKTGRADMKELRRAIAASKRFLRSFNKV